MTYGPIATIGSFLATNQTFSKDYEQFLLQITKLYADIARNINIRDIAIYNLNENPTGQQWYDPSTTIKGREGFRQTYTFGAIPAGGVLSFAHNISNLVQVTHRSCEVITTTGKFRPVPFTDTALITNQISIENTSTNIIITNGATAPAIVSGTVFLEYLRN